MEHQTISSRIQQLKDKYSSIIYYRKKNLAHFDFDYTIGNSDFGTTTHIDEVKFFFEEMLIIINETYSSLGFEKRVAIIMNPARFKGGREFNRILADYKNYYDQQWQ